MPCDSAHAPQLPLFVHDPAASPEALARYEALRPVLKGERSLPQQSQLTGINYWRLWRDLQRFQRAGLLGLVDQRTRPYRRGKPAVLDLLPQSIQQHLVRLAMAHPFTARELARIVREGYGYAVDHLPIKSGSSMCGIWSRLMDTGSIASCCSTGTVGPSWERVALTARTSPASSRSAARRSPNGVHLTPS
jgi:hypothetical protein